MSDSFTPKKRSEIMRAVKSKNNKSTELKLIQIFKANNITGWRRNYQVFGKPDFVFLRQRAAIFVDGCFWHGHNCRNTTPKQNREYWDAKIYRNKKRDRLVTKTLRLNNWDVIRIWECQLKNTIFVKNKLKRRNLF